MNISLTPEDYDEVRALVANALDWTPDDDDINVVTIGARGDRSVLGYAVSEGWSSVTGSLVAALSGLRDAQMANPLGLWLITADSRVVISDQLVVAADSAETAALIAEEKSRVHAPRVVRIGTATPGHKARIVLLARG